jgi:hypothetical protein
MSDFWKEHVVKWDWVAIGAVAAACATIVAAIGLLLAGRALKAAKDSNAIAARAHRGANIVCRKVDLHRDYAESATKTITQASEFEPAVPASEEATLAQELWLAAASDDDGELPILQTYVPGRALSVSAVLSRGTILASVARETLSFHPVAGGTSVWKRTIGLDDVGVREAMKLLLDIGYDGLAEVEYQVGADGVPRLMEIGPRPHGWLALACAAGVDLPLVAARALIGEAIPDQDPYRVGVEMRWPAGELDRIRDALRIRADLPPEVSRAQVLARSWPPWRPGMLYDNIDSDDPGPWIPEWVRRFAKAR